MSETKSKPGFYCQTCNKDVPAEHVQKPDMTHVARFGGCGQKVNIVGRETQAGLEDNLRQRADAAEERVVTLTSALEVANMKIDELTAQVAKLQPKASAKGKDAK